MPRNSVADLITQGYKITDSNTIFAGEPWEIEDPLLTEFDTAFHNLRDAQSLCLNLRVEKNAAADKVKIVRKDIDHAIQRLKRFIKYIADEATADNMIRDLAIEDDLPGDNDEAVSVLMSNVLPHLGNWDGTPQEISAAIKTEVTDATNAFASAVLESSQKQDLSEVATQDRDVKRGVYEDILARLRNFLYLMLPLERKDESLELYGFDVWGGETEPPAPEWPDWPGPVEGAIEQVAEAEVRIIYTGLNGGKTLMIERMMQGEAEYTIITQGLPLDDPEDPFSFDDTNLEKKKYSYRLVPFNEAMEAGVPLELVIIIH